MECFCNDEVCIFRQISGKVVPKNEKSSKAVLNFQNLTTRIARAQGSRIRRQNRKIITGKKIENMLFWWKRPEKRKKDLHNLLWRYLILFGVILVLFWHYFGAVLALFDLIWRYLALFDFI